MTHGDILNKEDDEDTSSARDKENNSGNGNEIKRNDNKNLTKKKKKKTPKTTPKAKKYREKQKEKEKSFESLGKRKISKNNLVGIEHIQNSLKEDDQLFFDNNMVSESLNNFLPNTQNSAGMSNLFNINFHQLQSPNFNNIKGSLGYSYDNHKNFVNYTPSPLFHQDVGNSLVSNNCGRLHTNTRPTSNYHTNTFIVNNIFGKSDVLGAPKIEENCNIPMSMYYLVLKLGQNQSYNFPINDEMNTNDEAVFFRKKKSSLNNLKSSTFNNMNMTNPS